MINRDHIMEVLRTIPDPEMPISIVDLGIVEAVAISPAERNGGSTVSVDILPTFVGCPALDMIRSDIERKLSALEGVESVEVNFVFDPPWSVDRITAAGRAALREHGVTVPAFGPSGGVALTMSAAPVSCPFCGSDATRLESAFGPTRCRMIRYCDACRNSFEHMKRV